MLRKPPSFLYCTALHCKLVDPLITGKLDYCPTRLHFEIDGYVGFCCYVCVCGFCLHVVIYGTVKRGGGVCKCYRISQQMPVVAELVLFKNSVLHVIPSRISGTVCMYMYFFSLCVSWEGGGGL